ncbi:hypothetical protein TNCV_3856791 [Trichonephila clavipes]|nr:hypothetical protein TNCV_3856791 [Trichonephila clavipes]
MYDDDTNVHTIYKRITSVTFTLNKHLKLLETYNDPWKISINVEKSAAVIFTKKRKIPPPSRIALLVKQFYENKGNASAAGLELRRRKNIRCKIIPTKGIPVMFNRFKETEKLGVQSGRGRKRAIPFLVDAVKTAVDAQSQISEFDDSRAHVVSRQTGYSYSTVQKVLRNIMHYSPTKSTIPRSFLIGTGQNVFHSHSLFSTE